MKPRSRREDRTKRSSLDLDAVDSDATTRAVLLDIEHRPEVGWGELLRRVESRIRVLAHFRMGRRIGAAYDVDDLVQEVWAEAVRSFERFEYRGPGSLQRWLAGILRMKILHAGRSLHRVPPPASSKRGALPPLGLREALEHTATGVSHRERRRELETKVSEALAKLPAVEREAILLKLYEGLSGREAAAQIGVDESTVSLRFKRGLERCARELRGFEP